VKLSFPLKGSEFKYKPG